ncbi:hypothetical protein BpHYR1_049510 [Brachionus plicatilis]|uniref:Uncharacterized protein n=1 Tax=Brachionus plicatilis TaxID=10195 RepID=A0A3M7P6W4_BRAPC|nr:hypothetical protein BpHYR1_049510 [Brachionus plicatilis]
MDGTTRLCYQLITYFVIKLVTSGFANNYFANVFCYPHDNKTGVDQFDNKICYHLITKPGLVICLSIFHKQLIFMEINEKAFKL